MLEKFVKPSLRLSKTQMALLIHRAAEKSAKALKGAAKQIEKAPISEEESALSKLARLRFERNPEKFTARASPNIFGSTSSGKVSIQNTAPIVKTATGPAAVPERSITETAMESGYSKTREATPLLGLERLTKRGKQIAKGRNLRTNLPTAEELMSMQPRDAEVWARLEEPMEEGKRVYNYPFHIAQRMLMESEGRLQPTTQKIPPLDIMDVKKGTYTRRFWRTLSAEKAKKGEATVQDYLAPIKETRGAKRSSTSVRAIQEKKQSTIAQTASKRLETVDVNELRDQVTNLGVEFQALGGARTAYGKLFQKWGREYKGYSNMTGAEYYTKVGLMVMNDPQRASKAYNRKHIELFKQMHEQFLSERGGM